MREGKIVDPNDHIYLLDKSRGFLRIPTVSGGYIEFQNLKWKNRDAFDANYFDLKVGGKEYRIQRDELEMALRYV